MNQCDGCKAGRPLKKNSDGNGFHHVMGSEEPGRYPDRMGCCADKYGYTIGEPEGLVFKARCSKCGETKTVCCDSGYSERADGFTMHESPVCVECCESKLHSRVIDGLGGQKRGE